MDLDEKRHNHMQRVLKMIVFFAILGCIVLYLATTYITRVFNEALPSEPAAESSQP